MKPKHFVIPYLLVPVLAALATWASGFWGYGGNGVLEYGLPFPWKTSQIVPTCASCPLPVSYNWVFFLLDIVFYGAIGYGTAFLYAKVIWKQSGQFMDPSKTTAPCARNPPSDN